MGKKAPVPAYAKIRVDTAEDAWAKLGLPKSLKSDSHGVSCGASSGLSWRPTATVTMKTKVHSERMEVRGGTMATDQL